MSTGSQIRKFRKELKLTQQELADRAGVGRTYVSDLEGDRYSPSIETIKKMAAALNVPEQALIGDNPELFNPDAEDEETRRILEELHKNPELKALLSVSRKKTKADLIFILELVEKINSEKNNK